MRSALVVAGMLLGATAFGQSGLIGMDRYPQFRGLSGLPGGGVGVTFDGHYSLRGAIAYSTPIGYAPNGGRISSTIGVVSPNLRPILIEDSGFDRAAGNGTGSFNISVDLLGGGFTFGIMPLSGAWDQAWTAQWGTHLGNEVGLAFGVQDLVGGGGSSGENLPGDNRSSRSAYLAVTQPYGNWGHWTVGMGTRRFQKGFANFSGWINNNMKAVVEHDGFGLNYGVAWSVNGATRDGDRDDYRRRIETTVFLGLVQNKYASWSIGVSF